MIGIEPGETFTTEQRSSRDEEATSERAAIYVPDVGPSAEVIVTLSGVKQTSRWCFSGIQNLGGSV